MTVSGVLSRLRPYRLSHCEINREARLHVKVDTGMSRLGADPEEMVGLFQRVAHLPNVHIEGLFTHFARAERGRSNAN